MTTPDSSFILPPSSFTLPRVKRAASWLLYATIPIAIFLQVTHRNLIWLFIFACLAVLPLAAWIGASTEQLARKMGSTAGALFNATFGNLAEMIIAIFAVRAGLLEVVKASLTGSILGNLLFVGGLSMLNAFQTVLTAVVLTGFVGRHGPAALAGYAVSSRSSLRETLPTSVFGSSPRNSTMCGTL